MIWTVYTKIILYAFCFKGGTLQDWKMFMILELNTWTSFFSDKMLNLKLQDHKTCPALRLLAQQ